MSKWYVWICLTSLLGCAAPGRIDKHIKTIEVASIPYGIETVTPISPSELYHRRDTFRTKIIDRDDLDYIQSRLSQADTLTGYKWWDARIVCVIHWSNSPVDTLIMGGFYQGYNGVVHKLDSLLLRHVTSYLSTEQQIEVDDYLREVYANVRWPGE